MSVEWIADEKELIKWMTKMRTLLYHTNRELSNSFKEEIEESEELISYLKKNTEVPCGKRITYRRLPCGNKR